MEKDSIYYMENERGVQMYLFYLVLWVIFNGNLTLEIFLIGLVVAAAVFAFTCKFMGHSLKKELRIYRLAFHFLRYVFVLVIEIVRANFAVIHTIMSEKEEPEPVLVSFHTDMETSVGRTLLANAITLTPGTITVSVENQDYVVHGLDESYAEGMDSSVMKTLLKEMEQK